MKNPKYICYYINSRGKNVFKIFNDIDSGLSFCKILDKRIEKGTCFGYDFVNI